MCEVKFNDVIKLWCLVKPAKFSSLMQAALSTVMEITNDQMRLVTIMQ